MQEDLENKTEPTTKKGSNLEIALTVTLGVLGALIGSAIVENTGLEHSYNILYVGGGATIGAAAGQGISYVINRLRYSRKSN